MSRRKQSNPKSIKRKSEDELEEIALTHHLPISTLVLRHTDEQTNGCEFGVYSACRIRVGTEVGRYKARAVQVDEEQAHLYQCLVECTSWKIEEGISHISVEEDVGHWLKLLQLSSDNTSSNVTLSLTDFGYIRCTVTKDINEDTQLVAMLIRDLEHDLAVSPAVASPPYHAHFLDKDMGPRDLLSGATLPANCTILHANYQLTTPGQTDTAKIDSRSPSPHTGEATYDCAFCGVRFTSHTTLYAHETIYCPKRPLLPVPQPQFPSPALAVMAADELPHYVNSSSSRTEQYSLKRKSKKRDSSPATPPLKMLRQSRPRYPDNDSHHGSESNSSDATDDEKQVSASQKAGHGTSCPHCTFTSAHVKELDHHLRLHFPEENANSAGRSSTSPRPTTPTPMPPPPPQHIPVMPELYCKECEIQFTSVSTFRGHKEHYCQQRRRTVAKRDSDRMSSPRRASPARASPKPHSPAQGAFQFPRIPAAMAMTSPPVIPPGVPTSLMTPASLGLNPALLMASPMMAAAYSMPLLMHPMVPALPNPVQAHHTSAPAVISPKPSSPKAKEDCAEQPLDLTTTKKKVKPSNRSDSAPAKVITIEPQPDKSEKIKCEVGHESGKSSPSRLPSHLGQAEAALPIPPQEALLPPHPLSVLPLLQQQHAAMMLSQSHQQQVNMSKCMDCNIVFYKHENFVAHKEHYCASRRGRGAPDTASISSRSPVALVSPVSPRTGTSDRLARSPARSISPAALTPSPASSSRTPEADNPLYFCQTCKIKFSSPDNLKAHQSFYCPGRGQEANKASEGNSDVYADGAEVTALSCHHCSNTFASTRLLKLHYCTGTAMHLPLFHCPYCDYIAQSDSRLVEHIKAHAPSKAYKCSICGYRGNTVRGMRMHGKMHIDNGENFTDEHMLEFEEPPLIPKRMRSDSAPVDWEGELLRMKCEPYKRRRSRKGYEKVEYMQQARQGPHVCVDCNSMFEDTAALLCHMQSHLAPDVCALRCSSCDYVAENPDDLNRHNKRKHGNDKDAAGITNDKACSPRASEPRASPLRNSLPCSPTPSDKSSNENNNSIDITTCNKERGHPQRGASPGDKVKPEADDSSSSCHSVNGSVGSPSHSTGRPAIQHDMASILNKGTPEKTTSRHCKQCDITFTYLSTFVAHKKYYCNSHAHERSSCQT